MTRRVPIKFADCNAPIFNRNIWVQLYSSHGGNLQYTAVEIKGFYAISLIHDTFCTVDFIMEAEDAWPNKYLPAYGLFSSGVDLLGRCLTGNTTINMNENLRIGFHYLSNPILVPQIGLQQADMQTPLIITSHNEYTIEDLVALRHYTLHGQATVDGPFVGVDNELLAQFPSLIVRAMEVFYSSLQQEVEMCQRMGEAEIGAYGNRIEPLKNILNYFSQQGTSMTSYFDCLDWTVR